MLNRGNILGLGVGVPIEHVSITCQRSPPGATWYLMHVDETAIAELLTSHLARNCELRANLEHKGVELDEPRPVDFHFWAFSQRDAAVVARSLYQMGFLLKLL